MTALDTLARNASDAIHESVADIPVPVAPVGVVAGAAGAWRIARYAFAGAAAGLAVLLVLVFSPPQEDTPSDTTVPTTTVVTSTTVADAPPTTIANTPTTVPSGDATPPVVTDGGSPGEAPPTEEDTEPPLLEVISPTNGARLETSVATFVGRTEAGADVLASGKFGAAVDADGSWTIDLVLAPGANGVVFVATDDAGNTSEVRMTVYYDAPEAKDDPKNDPKDDPKDTTTTTKATWEFTASQKYGNCSEPVPYDEFTGTAKPGSSVTISSPYGGGSTTADAEGNWWIRVEFPSAPYNKVFSVHASDEFGTKRYFEFVSLYEG